MTFWDKYICKAAEYSQVLDIWAFAMPVLVWCLVVVHLELVELVDAGDVPPLGSTRVDHGIY